MDKDDVVVDFSLLAGSVLALLLALFTLLLVPAAKAAPPTGGERPDLHTRKYLKELDEDRRRELQEAVSRNLIRSSGRENASAIPQFQIYYSVFLEILLDPLLGAGMSAADLDLIRSLPAPDDGQFAILAQRAMTVACQVADKADARSSAAVSVAVNGMRRAERDMENILNERYSTAVTSLSEAGKSTFDSVITRLLEQDRIVHAELDLDTLAFHHPDFVVAFLRDSCSNAERVLSGFINNTHTLQEQIEDDYHKGAVQLYQPQ